MSGSLSITVAANPTAVQTATQMLAMMAALSGTATDYNPGSQIRTFSEATGASLEQQGIAAETLAFQSLVYGALSLFDIEQAQATFATGTIILATSLPLSGAAVVTQAVAIPSGTFVQSAGGVQAITTVATTLFSGAAYVAVPGQALIAGAAGNIPASGISGQPLTSLGYPLVATNPGAFAGGSDAGTQSNALALFASKAASLGLASPVAVANAAIGTIATGTGETVQKAAVFEPWLAAGSGAGSGTAGFILYIDDGAGGASPDLINAVRLLLLGNQAAGQSGYRPAGVPFQISGVTPVYATVSVSGTLNNGLLTTGSVYGTTVSGIASYFNNLGISPNAANQPQIAAVASDAGIGAWQSLTVSLFYAASGGTPVPVVSGGVGTRVILSSLDVTIGTGF